MDSRTPVVILGAGPAGLGAAFRLARRREFAVTVIERNTTIGGNAGSFELEGIRVDFGSHRLHPSCSKRVFADIKALLADDILTRPRHGRIYLRGRWVHFPLKPMDLAFSLPPSFLLGVLRDAFFKGTASTNGDSTFATELEKGLGKTICRSFYFPYATKIWGHPPAELDAEQARRRVSANSLKKMLRKVLSAVPGIRSSNGKSFLYPKHGFGQISEAYYRAAIEAGVSVKLGTTVSQVILTGDGPQSVRATSNNAHEDLPAQLVLSTIPVTKLVEAIHPQAPAHVLASAASLKYRAMILVYLVLDADRFSQFDAHYFPGADVSISRLSEPKNYGLAELPGTTVLCAELPCDSTDRLWSASDEELQSTVTSDLERVGLALRVPIRKVTTRRLMNAYPIYLRDYRQHFDCVDQWASSLKGIVSLGRQGLFAHDNTHHTLEMAYAASDCITSSGDFDAGRWAESRRTFESHIVED